MLLFFLGALLSPDLKESRRYDQEKSSIDQLDQYVEARYGPWVKKTDQKIIFMRENPCCKIAEAATQPLQQTSIKTSSTRGGMYSSSLISRRYGEKYICVLCIWYL